MRQYPVLLNVHAAKTHSRAAAAAHRQPKLAQVIPVVERAASMAPYIC